MSRIFCRTCFSTASLPAGSSNWVAATRGPTTLCNTHPFARELWIAAVACDPWLPYGAPAVLLHLPVERVQAALLSLEAEGMALRGRFLPAAPAAPAREQFCDRRLLLLCGKWMFFYESFGTFGVPSAIQKSGLGATP